MVDMRGSIYYQLATLHKTYDVLQANKDSKVITLSSTSGITPGDILLINQLNDNNIVDPVGVEGKCTYCGYEGGNRALGQLVEVKGVADNQVTLTLPLHWTYNTALDPWAYQVDPYAMIHYAGLEDLTLTQDAPSVEFVIEMDGAQYSWVNDARSKMFKGEQCGSSIPCKMRSGNATFISESTDMAVIAATGYFLMSTARIT